MSDKSNLSNITLKEIRDELKQFLALHGFVCLELTTSEVTVSTIDQEFIKIQAMRDKRKIP